MPIIISPKVEQKLKDKHGVTPKEVTECFLNRVGNLLIDTREQHKTDPATLWFLARTNQGRLLKVAYVKETNGKIFVKSCYGPCADEERIYRHHNAGLVI